MEYSQRFEEYLAGIHTKLNPQILDDELPDSFNDWLGDLDGEDFMKWAELYGQQEYLAGKKSILNQLKGVHS